MLTHLIVSSIVGASFAFSGEEEPESRKFKKPTDCKIQKVVLKKISARSEISALFPTEVYPKEILKQIYREGFKNREMPRRRPDFEPSDAGGTQNQWLSDAGRTNFSITSGIKKRLKKK